MCDFFFSLHDKFLQGSVANKFYVHNDIFRYEDEVFGDSEAELDEGKMLSILQQALDVYLFSSCFCDF